MTSKYLNRVKAAVDAGLFSINGNRLLIEMLEEGEVRTASGLIASTGNNTKHYSAADRARVAVVLLTGPGYETEAGEKVNIPYNPGDTILVNQFGVKTFSRFFGIPEYAPDSIGLITDDLIQGKINNFTAFIDVMSGK